jgi:integrase/recombinase XerD
MKACPHRERKYKKCGCPIWVQGTLNKKPMKKSLDLRNWEAAQRIVRDWESGHSVASVLMKDACDRFYANLQARKKAPDTLSKYKRLMDELRDEFKNRSVAGISVDELDRYWEAWKLSPISIRKKLERLRTFFRFCQDRGWIQSNPAKSLEPPNAKPLPTLPFTSEEVEKIHWAIDLVPPKGRFGLETPKRVRAFVDLLLFSGLRIRDAATLSRDKIDDGKLMLYTSKTGTPVWMPLPKQVLQKLEKIDGGDRYYFWTGNGSPKSGVSIWQRSLAKVFKTAGIRNGHAHRFRDTFSVNLLQAGVPLETVSILLGHSSLKITEKHYNPWVKSRQIALTAEIEKAWRLT